MKRNLYFEYLRAIAILMVVAIHCYNYQDKDSVTQLTRNVFNCAVPLFFAISGFFLGKKEITTRKSYFDFVRVQVPKVYLPMLVWSIPFLIINLLNRSPLIENVTMFFIGGLGVFYFVAVIIQFYFLLPIMIKFVDKAGVGAVIYSFAVSELCVAFVTYYNIIMGMHLPTIVYAGLFPLWFVFYITGIYLGRLSDRRYNPIWSFLLVLIGLVFSQLETKYLYDLYGAGHGIKPSSFMYSEAVVLFLFSGRIEELTKTIYSGKKRVMIFLGSISFGIYLVHYHFKN